MKRGLLAVVLLLVSAGLASADYVIITANVGTSSSELKTAGAAGMMGMRGGPMGPGAGGPGAGGFPPGGAQGMPPGMDPRMGQRGGMGAAGGGPAGGMMGMMGMRGGMMGMRGGGSGAGMMGGMAGATGDIDDIPYFIVAVVEVEPTGGDLYKKLNDPQKAVGGFGVAKVTHKWGKTTLISTNQSSQTNFDVTVHVLTNRDKKPLPTVLKNFDQKFTALTRDKPSAEGVLTLAEWALQHGLAEQFPQVMDKLVEIDKKHPAAVAYQKVKADLDKPAAADAAPWRTKLLPGFKAVDGAHYTIVHNASTDRAAEVPSHLAFLENTFRGFYYWFALKGVALPVPTQRQLVVLTAAERDFNRLQRVLTASPVVVDGFFARRENVAVMAAKRSDEPYDALTKFSKKWEDKGLTQKELLTGKAKPKAGVDLLGLYEGEMVALMLRAMEEEAERATISHDASRQLLFASGLLPRNVAAPEWVQFGAGSFFETPLQSPWPSLAAPSPYYLPRWHDLKNKGFEKTPGDTLKQVVTDAYFRSLPPEGAAGSEARHAYDAAVRKARTSAWALTYFLANQKLNGLQQYFRELSKMPRDIDLDDEVLLTCFARAFNCVDPSGKVDSRSLSALAGNWYSYMENVKFEAEGTLKDIREVFRKKLAEQQKKEKEAAEGAKNQGQPFGPNGFGPGVPPGAGGNVPPPGRGPGG